MALYISDSEAKPLARRKRQLGWVYAASLILLLLIVLASIYFALSGQQHRNREQEQLSELAQMQQKLTEEINSVSADLVYFAQSDLAIATLTSGTQEAKSFLTSLMFKIGSVQQRYDQLRLLDRDGNEVVRLNQADGSQIKQILESELQNKADRYYFQESLKLQPGEIYISQFDLNMEQGKVERPLKPMIRFSTPIHDQQGRFLGVGILNYNGSRIHNLLDNLNLHEGDQVIMINAKGYYLKSPMAEHEWGFMLPERSESRFGHHYPEIWQALQDETINEASSTRGEFYFTRFKLQPTAPLQSIEGESITLIMHVPNSVILQSTMILLKGLIIAFLVLAPIFAFLGWRLGRYQVKQTWLFNKLAFEARHDSLTGIYNRKAIMEFLKQHIRENKRRQANLSIGFVDLNDLKLVNDHHGHEVGDELIKAAAKAIQEGIRSSDAAARIGGDEFLIVLVDCDEKGAQSILGRIDCMFTAAGALHAGLPWSLSYGYTQQIDAQDSAERMIERADNRMYQHKQQLKSQRAG